MNDQHSSSRQHFLQYAGEPFSGKEKKSIGNEFYTIIGVEEPPPVAYKQDFNNFKRQQSLQTVAVHRPVAHCKC